MLPQSMHRILGLDNGDTWQRTETDKGFEFFNQALILAVESSHLESIQDTLVIIFCQYSGG